MKRFLFLVLLFIGVGQIIQAQNFSEVHTDSIYNSFSLDKEVNYPGGIKEFTKFVSDNFEPPASLEFKGGKVITSFVVNTDGSLSYVKILKDAGFDTGEEMRRLLSICEKWIPGEIGGMKVKSNFVFPIVLKEPKQIQPEILPIADVSPNFPGGMKKFYEFIGANFKVPKDVVSGKVYVQFMVNVDGSLSDITVLRDVGIESRVEAIRVLNKSPKWIPGTKDGLPVKVKYVLPISIQEPEVRNNYPQQNSQQFHLHGRY